MDAATVQAVIGSTVIKSLEAAEAQLDAEIEALDKLGEDDIEACVLVCGGGLVGCGWWLCGGVVVVCVVGGGVVVWWWCVWWWGGRWLGGPRPHNICVATHVQAAAPPNDNAQKEATG
jgi:hypothetical protein